MAESNGTGDNRTSSASNLKKLSGDLEKMTSSESSDSLRTSSTCLKTTKCLLIISMSLTIILTAIIIAILKFNILDNEDQCLIANQPFHDNQYKLFTTKTTYKSAYSHISDSLKSGSAPSVFSKHQTLRYINDQLAKDNCKVTQLHYYGRHAARFPDAEDIKRLNQAISAIQARIDLSKFSLPVQANPDANKSTELPSDSVTIVRAENSTSALQQERVCSNPMTQYKQWRSSMHPDQDNLITDSGFEETEAIAKRLKEIFPQMFNASLSDIKIHTTSAIRTAQTAVPFMKNFDNYRFGDRCAYSNFPTTNLSNLDTVHSIKSNKCLRDMLEKSYSDKLDSHNKCAEMAKIDTIVGPELYTNHFSSIARSISERLKLPITSHLKPVDVKNLYSICIYETALSGSSIWCNLFSETELKFQEYFDDVEDFYKDVYGDTDQIASACPVANELYEAFDTATKESTGRPQAHFHFTHSQLIRKMAAATFDLSLDQAYQPETVDRHLREGSVPNYRDWRTSLFTPFSANLLYTLYECKPTTSDTYREISVNGVQYKVVASLNEHPITINRCPDVLCEFKKFAKSKIAQIGFSSDCELPKHCRKKYKMKKTT